VGISCIAARTHAAAINAELARGAGSLRPHALVA
jgi:hypothetical protein